MSNTARRQAGRRREQRDAMLQMIAEIRAVSIKAHAAKIAAGFYHDDSRIIRELRQRFAEIGKTCPAVFDPDQLIASGNNHQLTLFIDQNRGLLLEEEKNRLLKASHLVRWHRVADHDEFLIRDTMIRIGTYCGETVTGLGADDILFAWRKAQTLSAMVDRNAIAPVRDLAEEDALSRSFREAAHLSETGVAALLARADGYDRRIPAVVELLPNPTDQLGMDDIELVEDWIDAAFLNGMPVVFDCRGILLMDPDAMRYLAMRGWNRARERAAGDDPVPAGHPLLVMLDYRHRATQWPTIQTCFKIPVHYVLDVHGLQSIPTAEAAPEPAG